MLGNIALLVLSCAACQAFILGRNQSHWDGLKVTWSINPLTMFQGVPRTIPEATSHGWVKMDTGTTCQNGPFLGERFWKDGDLGVILLFDVHGYIAGIQAGIEKNYSPNPNHFPFPPLVSHPMVAHGTRFYITAYFVPTDKICSTGRTETEFRTQGTGSGLWIQNGTNPLTDSRAIPMTIEAARVSRWTEGKCFATMGVHFWYNIHKDMSCENFYPMFLLYNGGVLNGFGWAFMMNIQSSKRLEHPGQNVYASFMKEVPTCMNSMGTITTLHIYLTSSATADNC
ncbi:uncharacterized protein LOC127842517 [Dreissena polymorpha]|uniref:Uncharacterized protein n=1 Tax=Dreissena polymorpha TaxID=45954 RepID=A0A9D4IUM8_DREPO|nr:uncharacterized protein LOC127842517 [Dreissena polymorpha]KAH3787370.1 hypothetical protein DPMN_165494 [Dreissena polymorpha]